METIKIKYLSDIEPIRPTPGGDWLDLRAAKDTAFSGNDYVPVPLGVAMELPEGYEAIVAPRSSLFKHHGCIVPNSISIIDESYCGDGDEWHLLCYGTRRTVIKKGERIAQFRIVRHQPPVDLQIVDTLGNPDRGGIGSTGKE